MKNTVVIDNGGYTIKAGVVTQSGPRFIPNCITKAKNERGKVFVGDQLSSCKDYSGLFYIFPFQKGYLVNWEIQRQIWDFVFSKDCLHIDTKEHNVVMTEPQFNFPSIKDCMDEILFEDYRFNAVLRTSCAQLSATKLSEDFAERRPCCLVVDSGFSFTHIVPIYDGRPVKEAIQRINVGGKVLTNYLKEIISYRQLHVMDETYVMNQVKEDCCYVSHQFNKDMEIAQLRGAENSIARDYVLPDYTNVKRGYVRPLEEMLAKKKGTEQVLRMNNERFAVPEALFHPSDIGIQEMGIPEAVIQAVSLTPLVMQPHLLRSIVLTGGNVNIPGFKERVEADVRSLAPADFDVAVTTPENPITYPWQGGITMAAKDDFLSTYCVTKAEYEESGRTICSRKFDGAE